MPRVFAPSVNNTTMSGTKPFAPAGPTSPVGASPTGCTLGFTSAIASRLLRMAEPMAVPTEVVSPSIAPMRALRSVVGGTASCAAPENTTIPMRVPAG